MSSEQLLLTVDSGSRRVEVVLPTDTPIAELVPRLLEVCGIPPAGEAGDRSQWVLALPDGEVLLGNRTLSQYDLAEKSLIQLRDVVGPPLQPAPPTDSTADTPRPVARRVKLPPPTALPRRLQAMGRGAGGARSEPEIGRAGGGRKRRATPDPARALGPGARPRRLARQRLSEPARRDDLCAPADQVRDDRGDLAEGRRRQDHDRGLVGNPAGDDPERPCHRGGWQPGLRHAG